MLFLNFHCYQFGSKASGSYCIVHWRGWWSRALRPSAELQLLLQDPPACSQSTDHLWAGTVHRHGCVPPRDTDSGSCSGSAHWWWCCRPSSQPAAKGRRALSLIASKALWFKMCQKEWWQTSIDCYSNNYDTSVSLQRIGITLNSS